MRNREKNYVFIDSQNLNLAIRDCGWKLDFQKLFIYLKHKYRVSKVYLFIGYLKKNKALYDKLKEIGYTIIFKPTLEYNNCNKEKIKIKGNVDAELVLHCMLEYQNFDRAIIISGDGDFYCLIEQLQKDQKLLKVGIPNKFKYSALLKRFSDYFFFVNRLRKILKT